MGSILEDELTELGRRFDVSRFAGGNDGKTDFKMTPSFGENNLMDGGVIN